MLFSEPKIPQFVCEQPRNRLDIGFSALQRAENSSISAPRVRRRVPRRVSVLFSEPKIPQSPMSVPARRSPRRFSALQRAENSSMLLAQLAIVVVGRFSALQRAENSSIERQRAAARLTVRFQCSSASRKFLNTQLRNGRHRLGRSFSALQRAENSSMVRPGAVWWPRRLFQCSSASRKFLNSTSLLARNSNDVDVSVLFSEPKIPQLNFLKTIRSDTCVSVLFSEPKIPQSLAIGVTLGARMLFQCSSASRKFLNCPPASAPFSCRDVSVLFSEPKIPQ